MSRNITPEELQKAYDTAFALHPREDVALRVTMDACDFLQQLESSQARRTRSARHWKVAIPPEQLLQYAVYTVSYERELDQESHRPRFTPIYQPTREDRIVRYVKHLIWRTYLLSARSIAVGIGCLLYAYKPSEIADLLFLYDDQSLRMIKMRLAQDLRRRFTDSGVVSPDGKSMRTIPASDNDQLIIEEALKAFTPWGTDHLETPSPDKLMLEVLFDEENPVSEWQRKHALIDPKCVGFAQLINEYNEYFSSTSIRQRLADPRGNLMLPDFGGGPDPSLQRFNARLLSDSEKMFLNERRKPSGPWAYLAEELLFLSEFGPMEDCLTGWTIPMYLSDEDGQTTGIHKGETENYAEARIGYSPCWNEFLERQRQIHASLSLDYPVVVTACGGTGQSYAASLKEDREQLLTEFNDIANTYSSDLCIPQLFELCAERDPNALAIVCGEERVTYGELNARANQLAHYLRALGIMPDDRVCILMERSVEMVLAVLGVLKAGAAYVPLDPTYPQEALRLMLEDVRGRMLLTQQHLRSETVAGDYKVLCLDTDWDQIAQQAKCNPGCEVTATNLAYVIYTSGSTGRPKGVQITHGALLNLIRWHHETSRVTAARRGAYLGGFGFDASVWELWPSLTAGASLHLPRRSYRKISVFDVRWSSKTSTTDRSSSGPNFFHVSGHGCESPPEPSCFVGSGYGEQSFLRNGIDGAICVWESTHEQSQTQRPRPAHAVLLLGNAQKESPNRYADAGVLSINQSRPTQPFTFQGL